MIERGTLGGTCVNVGCVPSKIMLRAGHIRHLRESSPFDAAIGRSAAAVDRPALIHQLQSRVAELCHEKYEQILAENPAINLLRGTARFKDGRTLTVMLPDGMEREVAFDRVLLAIGASPDIPRCQAWRVRLTGRRPKRSLLRRARSTSSSTEARPWLSSWGRRSCGWAVGSR